MTSYIPIRNSQIFHYLKTPLYIKAKDDQYVLYKAENTKIDADRLKRDDHPMLYIPDDMKEIATEELQHQLKEKLLHRIKAGDLKSIKLALADIVQESFKEPFEENLQPLPETLDILYQEYYNTSKLIKNIANLQFGGTTLVDHSVNSMVLALNFCIYYKLPERDTKSLGLGALLHDIGLTKIDNRIVGASGKLTDEEFAEYKTHAALGHDIIKENLDIDLSVATGVLEHHERLDGKGYPRGISNVSYEGGLIGMIDSFENLTNNEKAHRRKEEPFGAMKIIQNEILETGKFDRGIFSGLCMSLLGRKNYC